MHLKQMDSKRLKIKGWVKVYQAHENKKKSGVVILLFFSTPVTCRSSDSYITQCIQAPQC